MLRKLRTHLCRDQHGEQNDNTKTANESFESVTECKYLGAAVTNNICIHQEINASVNSRDSIKKILEIFKPIIPSVVLMVAATVSLKLRSLCSTLGECAVSKLKGERVSISQISV